MPDDNLELVAGGNIELVAGGDIQLVGGAIFMAARALDAPLYLVTLIVARVYAAVATDVRLSAAVAEDRD